MKARVAAARILAELLRQRGSLASSLPNWESKVPEADRPLLRELCFGTMRHYPRLRLIASKLLDKPLRAKDSDIQALLLLGLHQLCSMRIPDHAAISETAGAAKGLKKTWATGVINAALRRYQREGDAIEASLGGNPEFQKAHPRWLLEAYQSAWPTEADSIISANNAHPPLTLRLNTGQMARTNYIQRLHQLNIEATSTSISPSGITLTKPTDPRGLPGFAEGLVSVQDEAAQLAAMLLDPQAGERILDACSAPGGKTCHLLQLQPKLQQLIALDTDNRRLEKVQENLDRLGLNALLLACDARETQRWWDGAMFDRILLDAPCSATGVIRRQSDIKLLRQPEDIDKLAQLQFELLNALWATLRPGGILLYATCSVMPAENDAVIGQFVDSSANCECLPLQADWGLTSQYGRQLLPTVAGHDGFYYAKLRKLAK